MTANVARIVGIADFVGGLDRDPREGAAAGGRQPKVPDDVLDDDDGVVHQDADREDQREERDPVEGVAEEHEDEERQGERDGDGQQHHARLAPAEGEGHQERDGQRGQRHVLEKLVGFLRGRLAVVPSHRRPHVGRHDPRRERIEFAVDRVDDGDRVGPTALAHRESDGREATRTPGLAVGHVGHGALRAVDDRGDVGKAHGPAVPLRDDDGPELGSTLEKAARLDGETAVGRNQLAGRRPPVRGGERAGDRAERQPAGGEPRRIELDAELAAQAADERRVRDFRDRLDLVLHLRGDLPQRRRILRRAPERQRPDGHVVDGTRLDQRRWHVPGPDVREGVELRVHPDERAVRVLPDPEAHDQKNGARGGRRVDVLHAGDRPERLLERRRHFALDFDGAAAGQRREDVDHRNLDLRLLFPGGDDHGQGAEREREHHEQRREAGIDESRGQAPGHTEPRRYRSRRGPGVVRHEAARVPAARSSGGSSTTRSPASSPDRTSICPGPAAGPVRT